jgi:hypothetical protein
MAHDRSRPSLDGTSTPSRPPFIPISLKETGVEYWHERWWLTPAWAAADEAGLQAPVDAIVRSVAA